MQPWTFCIEWDSCASYLADADCVIWHAADPHRVGKIVGGVLGGVLPVLFIAAVAGIILYSRSTYEHRAQKRLLQDQVYNLVMGVRHDDVYTDDIDPEAQVLTALPDPSRHSCQIWIVQGNAVHTRANNLVIDQSPVLSVHEPHLPLHAKCSFTFGKLFSWHQVCRCSLG